MRSRISAKARALWLIGGIIFNLALIGYFKYAGFLVSSVNDIFSASFVVPHIALPRRHLVLHLRADQLSVETRQSGRAEPSLVRYALFVSFFPHLIAGPIIRPHQLLPQFSNPALDRFDWQNFAIGTTFLLFGLFKKVILADGIAVYASPVFAAAASGGTPGVINAWGAALAYTFQIYFDFSGYSDMAIGLGLMFGIVLPFNFNSPYKATEHHRLLAPLAHDPVAVPARLRLHSARRQPGGAVRRYVNIMLTMLIGGLWHGANWTFVVWGGLHGMFLLVNHAWRSLRGERETTRFRQWSARVSPSCWWCSPGCSFGRRASTPRAAFSTACGDARLDQWPTARSGAGVLEAPEFIGVTRCRRLARRPALCSSSASSPAGDRLGPAEHAAVPARRRTPDGRPSGLAADARLGRHARPLLRRRLHLQHHLGQSRQRIHLLHLLSMRGMAAATRSDQLRLA